MDYGLSAKMPPNDEWQPIWEKNRRERGFDNTELWNLDFTIVKFILPHLIEFRDKSLIQSEKEFILILDEMIFAFSYINEEKGFKSNTPSEETERMNKGLNLFREYYFSLWL